MGFKISEKEIREAFEKDGLLGLVELSELKKQSKK